MHNNFFLYKNALFVLSLVFSTAAVAAPKTQNQAHPNPNKPFEGEWRMCIETENKTQRCASYYLIQQGIQVCGTWEILDGGRTKPLSGFVWATAQSSQEAEKKNALAVANVDFGCNLQPYRAGWFTSTTCGKHKKPLWEKTVSAWNIRIARCDGNHGDRTIADFINPSAGFSSICPVEPQPYEANEFFPLSRTHRSRLMQLTWMNDCLSGKKPEKIKVPY